MLSLQRLRLRADSTESELGGRMSLLFDLSDLETLEAPEPDIKRSEL